MLASSYSIYVLLIISSHRRAESRAVLPIYFCEEKGRGSPDNLSTRTSRTHSSETGAPTSSHKMVSIPKNPSCTGHFLLAFFHLPNPKPSFLSIVSIQPYTLAPKRPPNIPTTTLRLIQNPRINPEQPSLTRLHKSLSNALITIGRVTTEIKVKMIIGIGLLRSSHNTYYKYIGRGLCQCQIC